MLDKLIDLKKVTHIRKDTGGGGEEGGKGTRISKWGGGMLVVSPRGCKFLILVLLKVFCVKRHYTQP